MTLKSIFNGLLTLKSRWVHHTSFLWSFNSKAMSYLSIPKKQPVNEIWHKIKLFFWCIKSVCRIWWLWSHQGLQGWEESCWISGKVKRSHKFSHRSWKCSREFVVKVVRFRDGRIGFALWRSRNSPCRSRVGKCCED